LLKYETDTEAVATDTPLEPRGIANGAISLRDAFADWMAGAAVYTKTSYTKTS
jgi:hypothetical protein